MKKTNKIYNLTIVYNDDTEQVEYLEETITRDDDLNSQIRSTYVDVIDYWDEETEEILNDKYIIAEA